MASRLERNLAASVFKLQKRGSNVPPAIRAAARRVLQRKDSKSDVENIRRWLGISRSGTGAAGRVGKRFQRVQGQVFSVSRDLEQIRGAQERGESTTLQTARLFQNLNFQVQRAIKTKWAKQAAEKGAQFLGKDPVVAGRFLKALGRGLRLGGLVATATSAAFAVAEGFFKRERERQQLVSKGLDLARQINLDPRLRRQIEQRQRDVFEREQGVGARARDAVEKFLGFLPSGEVDIQKRLSRQIQTASAARRIAPQILGNVDEILARTARAKNKFVGELTPRERAEALDNALQARIDPLQLRNDPRIQRQLTREMNLLIPGVGTTTFPTVTAFFRNIASEKTFGLIQSESQVREARRIELAKEFMEKEIARFQRLIEEANEDARQIRQRRTPEEALAHRERIEFAAATWNSQRSRHKAWSND